MSINCMRNVGVAHWRVSGPRRAGVPQPARKRLAVRVAAKEAQDDIRAFLEKPDAEGIKAMTSGLLESDPEVKEQLQKIQEAMARVDRAKAAQIDLEREYEEAKLRSAKSAKQAELDNRLRAEEVMANAEIRAAEKMLQAAELSNVRAQQERARIMAELNNDAGRIESGKAASAAVVGGVLGSLPFLLIGSESGLNAALSFVAALASCALFGVTYRWTVGNSPDNQQLRGGVVAAFGLVRAAAAADILQVSSPDGIITIEVIGSAALYAAQSMLMFGFSAAVVEYGFRQGLIKLVDPQPKPLE